MCPVAAESKNSKPSSKKKINEKINTNLEKVVGEDSDINSQNCKYWSIFFTFLLYKNKQIEELKLV